MRRSLRTSVVAAITALAALSACTPSNTGAHLALARECRHLEPGADLVLVLPRAPRPLGVQVEEQGVSVVAALDGAAVWHASPVQRFGSITLLSRAHPDQAETLRIRRQDAYEGPGEVCISAESLARARGQRLEADAVAAAGAAATYAGQWQVAFEAERRAARGYEALGLPSAAAGQRHAMAELAYRRLDRKRDAYAIATLALAQRVRAGDATARLDAGLLTALRAKALLDLEPTVTAPEIRRLLGMARKDLFATPAAERELPRLELLEGLLDYLVGASADAGALWQRAAERCESVRDWECYVAARQDMAQLAEQSGDFPRALAVYMEALGRLPPGLSPKLRAVVLSNLAGLQSALGQVSDSERANAEAMSLYARLGDCTGERVSRARSGALLAQVGSLADAERELALASSGACRELLAPGPEGRAKTADPCSAPVEPDSLSFNDRLAVFNALTSLSELRLLVEEHAAAGRCAAAAARYADAAAFKVRLANVEGDILLASHAAGAAREPFERALKLAEAAGLGESYENHSVAELGLARAFLMEQRYAESLGWASKALRSTLARGDPTRLVAALRLIGSSYCGLGRLAECRHALSAAAGLIEAVPIAELDGEQRALFLAAQHAVFAELIDWHAAQTFGLPSGAWAAFDAAERGKWRSFRYALSQTDRAEGADGLSAQDYRDVLRQLPTVFEGSGDSGVATMVGRIETLTRLAHVAEATHESLQQTLRMQQATLIEYAAGSRDLLALVVDGAGIRFVRLAPLERVARTAARLRTRLAERDSPAEDVRSAARELAEQVLWPLSGAISAKRLIIVPDDALHTIPFSVLPWTAGSDERVIERAEITMIPAAMFLMRAPPRRGPRGAGRMLLIGDPIFRIEAWRRECVPAAAVALPVHQASPERAAPLSWTETLPGLPASRQEVDGIAALAQQAEAGEAVRTLLGCDATRRALQQAARSPLDLLHIASHVRIDAQRPRLSALALTPDDEVAPEGGSFTLLDILQMHLHSKLVVLSACDSSRGRLLPGEGILGPAQAFLEAGANSVVASFWRVDDSQSEAFMRRFYGHLLIERLPAAAALRRTQLESLARPSFDWASFALYGWPDTAL